MRFLADENLPGRLVGALRAAGYDVVWVRRGDRCGERRR
jgi:predicted nuclease of predicted toxin-antitoxin system